MHFDGLFIGIKHYNLAVSDDALTGGSVVCYIASKPFYAYTNNAIKQDDRKANKLLYVFKFNSTSLFISILFNIKCKETVFIIKKHLFCSSRCQLADRMSERSAAVYVHRV